ncbi:MAG: tetracycline regulation of excision, RteC [Flammeovirgaceae bacterium]|nr:tetracycline regulation of excision, RteC [Flammeovirgaceae bacterium]MBR07678.1 tetracycline regulation of excision, RteC [Rickettsiales bacterium]|tara:strand:+ start:1461 stop:2309 length:849 start_codon:yes stop_codon:yes gene_type:complete
MPESFNQLFHDLEDKLRMIDLEEDQILKKSEQSFQASLQAINQLRKTLVNDPLSSQIDEIYFFKEIKPKFVSKLIYHLSVFNIETNKPNGGIKVKRKYYQIQLDKLKQYFDNNLEFYRYYRTQSNYLDHKYFVRGKQDIRLTLDSFFFETDPNFSTSHDFKVSNILANDLLNVYLEDELNKLSMNDITNHKSYLEPKGKISWTESKVALIELMYGLHSRGVFNNGTADLKEIALFFEEVFGMELGQYHRTFLEIRIRKTGRTKFINSLQDSLIRRMDEADDK